MKALAWMYLISVSLSTIHAQQESLLDIIREGQLHGHVRNHFMGTIHKTGKDYATDAMGGLLGYETKEYKGFQLGVSGIFTYRVFSSDLNHPDPITQRPVKWERELFDVNDPENYRDLDRLESLFVKYHWENSYVNFGKIAIAETPLLNRSDGRMKPFAFQGLWLHQQQKESSWVYDAAWLYRVSPRSMVEWYSFTEAIGLTDNGFQPNGSRADYRHTPTKGIGVAHLGKNIGQGQFHLWNMYLDGFINTTWLQWNFIGRHWELGGLYSYQFPHAHQGAVIYEKRYVQPDENGQVLGFMAIYKTDNSQFKIGYTHAFTTGRFLFPRELGRDQFYTSIPRSRLDGLGGVSVVNAALQERFNHLQCTLEASTTMGTTIGDYSLNKYNADDYYQVNARLHYEFDRFFKGVHVELLYVWKENKQVHYNDMVYQKSDYNQFNLITNFNF